MHKFNNWSDVIIKERMEKMAIQATIFLIIKKPSIIAINTSMQFCIYAPTFALKM